MSWELATYELGSGRNDTRSAQRPACPSNLSKQSTHATTEQHATPLQERNQSSSVLRRLTTCSESPLSESGRWASLFVLTIRETAERRDT